MQELLFYWLKCRMCGFSIKTSGSDPTNVDRLLFMDAAGHGWCLVWFSLVLLVTD